ncbi:hypothetical protein YA0002_15265 [Pseudomonas cichorii]|uniref:hypothetical protein n=1 Tax=Pseudomonas cichorii TaxID=36746 RepID=UPI0018E5F47A|nr:hypothetical protein [Pseudomonas cichorii]MBI6854135.1 hypothetical protein [Pseudomonas cichorii]
MLMGRHLVTFDKAVESGLKNDILDCLLYAQLRADSMYPKTQAGWVWLEEYQRSITATGGRQFGRVVRNVLRIHGLRDLSRRPAFLDVADSPSLRHLLMTSFDTLMSSDLARAYFNSWGSSGRSRQFQVVPCEVDANGKVNILVCGLQMRTVALRPSLYFWEVLSGEMTVHYSGTVFRFNPEAYEPLRSMVQEALSREAKQAVIQL